MSIFCGLVVLMHVAIFLPSLAFGGKGDMLSWGRPMKNRHGITTAAAATDGSKIYPAISHRTFRPSLAGMYTNKEGGGNSGSQQKTVTDGTTSLASGGNTSHGRLFSSPFVIQNQVIPASFLFPAALGRDQKKEYQSIIFSVETGYSFLRNVSEFAITKQSGGGTDRWRIGDDGTGYAGVGLDINISDSGGYYARFETHFYENINLYFTSLGPKFLYPITKDIMLNAKAGVVYGHFNWDGPPGDFYNDFGWEIGGAVHYRYQRLTFGLDLMYRDIDFEYKIPSGSGVSSNTSDIDFSGYLLSALLGYTF